MYNTVLEFQHCNDNSHGVIHNGHDKSSAEGHTGSGRMLYSECFRDFGAWNSKEPDSNSRSNSESRYALNHAKCISERFDSDPLRHMCFAFIRSHCFNSLSFGIVYPSPSGCTMG